MLLFMSVSTFTKLEGLNAWNIRLEVIGKQLVDGFFFKKMNNRNRPHEMECLPLLAVL